MSQKTQEVSVAFPADHGWELWSRKSGTFELAGAEEIDEKTGEVAPFRAATHYAFPVVSVSAVPVWVTSDDPTILPGLIDMHLEKIGLKPELSEGSLIDYKVALRHPPVEEGQPPRILVVVSVLSRLFAHPLPRQIPSFYEISPRFLILPGNHIVVWKELNRLVCAVTRDDQLVYFQALASETVDEEAIREIQCMLISLEGEGVVEKSNGLVFWTDDTEEGIEEPVQRLLDLRIIREERPDPVLPAKNSKLVPNEVAIIREQQRKARRVRRLALGVAALYIIGIAAFAGLYVKKLIEVQGIEQEVADLRPQVGWIPSFQERWDRHEATIDANRFPMELFHQTVSRLPEKGVRFTSFTLERSYNDTDNTLERDQAALDLRVSGASGPRLGEE